MNQHDTIYLLGQIAVVLVAIFTSGKYFGRIENSVKDAVSDLKDLKESYNAHVKKDEETFELIKREITEVKILLAHLHGVKAATAANIFKGSGSEA